jgi:TetR/AcrR family transcriptional repressor of uid operon
MSLPSSDHQSDRRRQEERRSTILDAFEHCIVRTGFHRTTMQDVATEAGMSVGNLYRYFNSKEALVSGLIERDRERLRLDFATATEASDQLGALRALGRKHFVEEPRERSMQILEIWAEATHNPEVAEMCLAIESECSSKMIELLDQAAASGQIQPRLDTYTIVEIIMAIGDGMFRRRAMDPTFDAEEGFRQTFMVLELLLNISPETTRSSSAKTAPAEISV